MLLTGPFAMLSMPSFDVHLPPCTEDFLIHLSPLWELPIWQLPLFPSVAQFPCVEHESDDLAGNTVSCVYITNGKDTALQRQI